MEQGNKEIVDETQRNELNKDAEWSLRFAKRVWPSRLRQNGQVTELDSFRSLSLEFSARFGV